MEKGRDRAPLRAPFTCCASASRTGRTHSSITIFLVTAGTSAVSISDHSRADLGDCRHGFRVARTPDRRVDERTRPDPEVDRGQCPWAHWNANFPSMTKLNVFDAVVIGSGLGGLTAA